MRRSYFHAALFAALASVVATDRAHAQSLYGVTTGNLVFEQVGPPSGACSYPGPPVGGVPSATLSSFPVQPAGFPCPLPLIPPAPGATLGDVAIDKVFDTVWVTDGQRVAEYLGRDPSPLILPGTPIRSYVATPFPRILGMGMDSSTNTLWFTDGAIAWSEMPPAQNPCGGSATPVVAPFPVTANLGTVTDVSWDPVNGLLWAVDVTGFVTAYSPNGTPDPRYINIFVNATGAGILGAPSGIAIDSVATAVNGIPTFYVTDGVAVLYMMATGTAAIPTFYTPNVFFPTLGVLRGLAFAARAIPYGVGGSTIAGPAPLIESTGHVLSAPGSVFPFDVHLTGALPFATATLFLSTGPPPCPAPLIGGLPILLNLGGLTLVTQRTTGAFGAATVRTTLPPGYPAGAQIWLQWHVAGGTASQTSNALLMTFDRP